ncbi:MAG: IPExxxVDY family protein [Flavobacteriales bacterium]|nr:IPExxxVDY family protein [Flavobacteriales bacterium]MCX7650857.1 IPExxxVDY family protein [Flavobacteriales bacterium]MDW8432188.1 IPExxxVDY family protein [Flavobacteriales bacterium]
MKQRYHLDLSLDEMPLLLGLVSSLPEYTFAFHLDKTLHTRLTMTESFTFYHRKLRTFLEFIRYEYDQAEFFRFFRLVSNKCEGHFLTEKYGPLDYILVVFGDLTTGDRLDLAERVRQCPAVEFVRDILLDEREHRELLVR